jgi:preprotein translocase subunit SecG
VKKTGDLLEKLTWSFIILIMALTLSTNFITPNRGGSTNDILDKAGEQTPVNQAPPMDLNPEGAAPGGDTTAPQ